MINSSNMNFLIFGGSLGAKQVNEFVERLLKQIPDQWDSVKIIHQVGKNGNFVVSTPAGVEYEQFEYLDPMWGYYQWADIIIARAGASSLSELELVKRPVYLIPFQAATDNHQELNAKIFKEEVSFPVEIYNASTSVEDNVNIFYNFVTKNKNYNKPSTIDTSNSAKTIVETIMRDL
jgi:UDP-N-acetylglucosamine:LPS N-acetylglucosamine transferase